MAQKIGKTALTCLSDSLSHTHMHTHTHTHRHTHMHTHKCTSRTHTFVVQGRECWFRFVARLSPGPSLCVYCLGGICHTDFRSHSGLSTAVGDSSHDTPLRHKEAALR